MCNVAYSQGLDPQVLYVMENTEETSSHAVTPESCQSAVALLTIREDSRSMQSGSGEPVKRDHVFQEYICVMDGTGNIKCKHRLVSAKQVEGGWRRMDCRPEASSRMFWSLMVETLAQDEIPFTYPLNMGEVCSWYILLRKRKCTKDRRKGKWSLVQAILVVPGEASASSCTWPVSKAMAASPTHSHFL